MVIQRDCAPHLKAQHTFFQFVTPVRKQAGSNLKLSPNYYLLYERNFPGMNLFQFQ